MGPEGPGCGQVSQNKSQQRDLAAQVPAALCQGRKQSIIRASITRRDMQMIQTDDKFRKCRKGT